MERPPPPPLGPVLEDLMIQAVRLKKKRDHCQTISACEKCNNGRKNGLNLEPIFWARF
jgi:hypothetical protein